MRGDEPLMLIYNLERHAMLKIKNEEDVKQFMNNMMNLISSGEYNEILVEVTVSFIDNGPVMSKHTSDIYNASYFQIFDKILFQLLEVEEVDITITYVAF